VTRVRRGLPEGQDEPEGAALALLAVHPDLAAHQFHELLADGEAEAGPSESPRRRRIGLAEPLEEVSQILRIDADPVSVTSNRATIESACSCTVSTLRVTSPASVNLTAFPRMLTSTWRIRTGSPSTMLDV